MAVGEHEEYLEHALPGFHRYAAAHGYDLQVRRGSACPSRPASWSKLVIARELLTRYDLVFWADADTCFVDFSRDVADEIPRHAVISLVEHHYEGMAVPNMGVFVMRSGPATVDLIDRLWNDTRFVDHNWWENAALLDLIGYRLWPTGPERFSPYRNAVGLLPNDWNSIDQDPSPRPVLMHYAGKTHQERLERFARDAVA